MFFYGFKRDVQGIMHSSSNAKANGLFGGVGYSGYSTMGPVLTYFNTGNTKSFSSLKKILSQYDTLDQICQPLKKHQTIKKLTLDDKNNFFNILKQIKNNINKGADQNILDIIVKSKLSATEKYHILTKKYSGDFLISKLYNNPSFSDKQFKELLNEFAKSVQFTDKKEISAGEFTQLCANVPTKSADEILLYFYKLRSIAETDENEDSRKLKIKVLINTVSRSKNDSTSKWYLIRKHSKEHNLIVQSSIRIVSNFAYGAGTAACGTLWLSGGLLAPAAVPLLIICGLIRFGSQTAASYFEYGKTKQSKNLETAINREISEKLTTPQIYNEHIHLIIENGISGFNDSGNLIINKFKFKEYLENLDKDYPDDKILIIDFFRNHKIL